MGTSIAAGIAVAVTAAVANAFSVVLQSSEARESPSREAMKLSLLRRLAHRPRWLLGTGLVIFAGALQVLALALAPLAIVQPTLATGQLVLLVLARVKLGERVGRHEALSALAIFGGLSAVVAAAPSHSVVRSSFGSLLIPLLVVGVPAATTFVIGRFHRRLGLVLVAGAGLSYSWADFGSKLLARNLSHGAWGAAALWAIGIIAFGALAFLEENTALQERPAVTVAPVIGAIKVPLPVLMVLWTGLERWGPSPGALAAFFGGLALVAGGAASLGRSETVARVRAPSAGGQGPRGSRA